MSMEFAGLLDRAEMRDGRHWGFTHCREFVAAMVTGKLPLIQKKKERFLEIELRVIAPFDPGHPRGGQEETGIAPIHEI